MNGDVRDFVDRIHYGDELVFMYRGQKFFLEGLFQDDNKFTTYLDRWELPGTDYIWVGKGDKTYPVQEFLMARLWDGRTFWEAESEMEWVDYEQQGTRSDIDCYAKKRLERNDITFRSSLFLFP